MKDDNQIILLILVSIWGMISWYCLSRLYAKYRDLQIRLSRITEKQKEEQHYQGLVRTIFEILSEKFVEVKENIIINPIRKNK